MKCINKSFMAAIMVATTASVSAAWAQSDSIFFSTSNSLSADMSTLTGGSSTPGNTTASYTSLGQDTLYVWVTSVDNGGVGANQDITPPDTSYFEAYDSTGNPLANPWTPNSSSSIAVNYSITSGTSAVNFSGTSTDGAAIYNNTLTGSNAQLTTKDANGLTGAGPTYSTTVWDAASNYTYGASGNANVSATAITNVSASVVPTSYSTDGGTTYQGTQIPRGLALPSSYSVSDVTNPQYNSTAGAFLLGTVTFNAAANGTAVIQIQKSDPTGSGLGIVRGGGGMVGDAGDLTNAYTYYKSTITVNAVTTRLGDLTGDSGLNTTIAGGGDNINAMDIDQIASDIRAGLTYAQAAAQNGRNDALLGEVNMNALVSVNDYNHEIGTLVDINGGGVGGAHGTHPGDANLDGTANFGDYQTLLSHYNQVGGWASGDFNGDGSVNFGDYQVLLSNYNQSGGDGQFSPVPEPATFVLGGLGLVGLLFAKRRLKSA